MSNLKTMLDMANAKLQCETTSGLSITKSIGQTETFYCLTVPSGAFLVKSEGKTSITGNCLHSNAASWSYKLKLSLSNKTQPELDQLKSDIIANAKVLREHEHRIVDMIFSEGPIDGITDKQLKNFIDSRIDECLLQLGYEKIFNITYNPIAEWFYKSIADYQFNDNFTGVGNAYQRNWDAAQFTWNIA